MHIKSLRVEQFKRFRQPVLLDQLQPGLNIISAPNEAGKSTLAQALRTVFFERYNTSSLNDIVPWGDSSAAPEIELNFSMNGQEMRLSKRFLKRKRCDLLIGRERLDNDEAEQYLADQMGFDYAARGSSQARNWGVPGLLWIEQGQGQELRAAVQHAAGTLQQALGTEMADLTSADGDYVLEQAQQQLDQFVTQAQGQPRGPWLAARREREQAQAQLQRLEDELHQYQQWVDELASARRQVADSERNRPWESLRAQALVAQDQLKQARLLQTRIQELTQGLETLQERERVFQQAAQQDTALMAQRNERVIQVDALQREREHAQAGLDSLESRLQQARQDKEQAQQEYERARAWQQWTRDQAAHEQAEQQASQYQDQLNELLRHEAELAECNAALLQVKISDQTLAGLRQQSQTLQRLQHQLEAVSTELHIELDEHAALTVDGQVIRGHKRLHLTDSTHLILPGLGQMRVIPGGKELGDLSQQRELAQRALRQALQEQGVDSLELLERRREQARQHEQREHLLRATMKILAPKGKAHLQGLLMAAGQSRPPVRPEGQILTALDLERSAQQARLADQQWQALESDWRARREALASLAARHEQAQAEAKRIELQWSDPHRLAEQHDRALQWTALREQREQRRAELNSVQEQLEELPVAFLEQDVERLERSAQQQEEAYAQARLSAQLMQAKLETQGAQGLEEQIATTQAHVQDSERRCAAFERRAQALRLLIQVLTDQRRVLTQQLHQPLQKHINHYLRLLLGKASVELDEHLAPRWLQRDGQGLLADDIDGLSFGAREQIGLIARLAYADLLQQAGKPTLLILDDVLVHSDSDRLEAMKRILHDAAGRHQILLFTCQGDKWMDMGVPLRALPHSVQ